MIATRPKKNSGIDTPIIPPSVSRLSVKEPRLSALIVPRMEPAMLDSTSAVPDSSSVAGSRLASTPEIGAPPVRV